MSELFKPVIIFIYFTTESLKKNHFSQIIIGHNKSNQEWLWEVTHMSAEFSGVSEKIHGFIAPHSLCYQGLVGG